MPTKGIEQRVSELENKLKCRCIMNAWINTTERSPGDTALCITVDINEVVSLSSYDKRSRVWTVQPFNEVMYKTVHGIVRWRPLVWIA